LLGIDRRLLQNFDWVLFSLATILVAMGMANLYSATYSGSARLPAEVSRQLVSLGIGAVLLLVVLSFDYRRLERLAYPIFGLTLLLLASTLLFAPMIRGSRAWLVYGPLRLQPAEFAKVGLILALARYFHKHPPDQIRRLRDLAGPALIAACPVALILLQRDMGVAVLTLLIVAIYLPFVSIPLRAWLAVAVAAVGALAGLWLFVLAEYQRSRILDFLDPARDPLASGYQALQSRIAIGAGGLFGKGWLEGTQTQLRFLPTQHSDFVFSVLAEEWGFVGGTIALGTFLLLLIWGLLVARRSKDAFGAYLAIGVVGILFWPAVINVAMVVGLAPVIGVPLPLFSYGGSSLMATMLGIGLLLSVSMRRYVF
jgi:rod shape determining protein RodA